MRNRLLQVLLPGLVTLLAGGLGCNGPQKPGGIMDPGTGKTTVSTTPGTTGVNTPPNRPVQRTDPVIQDLPSTEEVENVEQMIYNRGEAHIHFARGVRLFSQVKPDFKAAAHEFQEAIALNPKHALAIGNLGVVRYEQERYGDAERFLKEAVRLEPTFTKFYFNLALVYGQQERWDLAVKTLEKVLVKNPRHREARRFLPKFRRARDKQKPSG